MHISTVGRVDCIIFSRERVSEPPAGIANAPRCWCRRTRSRTDEGSERKREEQSIARRDPGARVDVLPAFDPPGPAFQRVDDGERLSLRTGGLVVLRD